MDKKSLAILLVASSFACSSFAASTISKLMTKHGSTAAVKTHKITRQSNQSFTDFSGTWMVNCGDGPSMQTVIENDSDYITLDGMEYRIGHGMSSQSESNDDWTRSENISLEWNADGSALTIKSINFYKSHIDNSVIETDMYKSTLTMKNGQIILDGKWTNFKDITQIEEPIEMHCVFVKKQ